MIGETCGETIEGLRSFASSARSAARNAGDRLREGSTEHEHSRKTGPSSATSKRHPTGTHGRSKGKHGRVKGPDEKILILLSAPAESATLRADALISPSPTTQWTEEQRRCTFDTLPDPHGPDRRALALGPCGRLRGRRCAEASRHLLQHGAVGGARGADRHRGLHPASCQDDEVAYVALVQFADGLPTRPQLVDLAIQDEASPFSAVHPAEGEIGFKGSIDTEGLTGRFDTLGEVSLPRGESIWQWGASER
jgi:hypothetical protein